ncbi:MAG TPA: hypothetical protein VJJ23_03625 [Candidatus Nanoarchaeia archaeon]|nr:hypothetical protein [Candidatus Nanoarchaeia archaeon]
MISDKEILRLAQEIYSEFSINYLIDVKIEVLNLEKFLKIAEKVDYIKIMVDGKKIKNIKDISIPIISLSGEPFKIVICKNIVNKISRRLAKQKQKDFIKAIMLHELYHILNYESKRELVYNYLFSDKNTLENMKEDWKDFYKLLEDNKKKIRL